MGEIHQILLQKYNLSGELIYVITKEEEETPIQKLLEQEGFSKH